MSEAVMAGEVVTAPTKKPKKKKSKARIIIEWVLFGIFGAFFVVVVAGNINGEIHKKENYGQSIRFGVGSFIVLTDSMQPEIPVNAAIITYKEEVADIYNRFNKAIAAGKTIKIDATFANVETGISNFEPDTPEFQGRFPVVSNRIMTHRIREVHIREDVKFGNGRYVFVASGINEKSTYYNEHQYQLFTEKQYLGTVKISNQFLGNVFKFIVSPFGLIILLLVPAGYLIVVSTIDIFKTLKKSEEEAVAVDPNATGKLSKVSAEDRERLKKELMDEMIANKRKEKENERKD